MKSRAKPTPQRKWKNLSSKDRAACVVVERLCRAVGRDCQVIFLDDGVQLAPLQWSGDVNEESLADALDEALVVDP